MAFFPVPFPLLFLVFGYSVSPKAGCCSVTKSSLTVCDSMDYSTLGSPVLHCLPEFTRSHVLDLSVMLSNHIILCRLLLLPSIFHSIRVFSNMSHQVAKVLKLQHQSFQCKLRVDFL